MRLNKILLTAILLTVWQRVPAQQQFASPETARMHASIAEYLKLHNYSDAIKTARQAILIDSSPFFHKDLGQALFLNGNFEEAAAELNILHNSVAADTESIRMEAYSLLAQKKFKTAQSTINEGISAFPCSGPLLHVRGVAYAAKGDTAAAVQCWVGGTMEDPTYAVNYRSAAAAYKKSDRIIWSIIYFENYLNLPRDTADDSTIKNSLFECYKLLFTTVGSTNFKPENYRDEGFENAIMNTMVQLTPIVSDGLTTENLIMLRTRFLMDWLEKNEKNYPYPLFTYLNMLVSEGKFDTYNQWIFGKAESPAQYEAWTQFNEGALERFLNWKTAHQLEPKINHYNANPADGLKTGNRRKYK
jgi:tetratricopeptide (TPR) repeat protein